jgi:hypothetical protein
LEPGNAYLNAGHIIVQEEVLGGHPIWVSGNQTFNVLVVLD